MDTTDKKEIRQDPSRRLTRGPRPIDSARRDNSPKSTPCAKDKAAHAGVKSYLEAARTPPPRAADSGGTGIRLSQESPFGPANQAPRTDKTVPRVVRKDWPRSSGKTLCERLKIAFRSQTFPSDVARDRKLQDVLNAPIRHAAAMRAGTIRILLWPPFEVGLQTTACWKYLSRRLREQEFSELLKIQKVKQPNGVRRFDLYFATEQLQRAMPGTDWDILCPERRAEVHKGSRFRYAAHLRVTLLEKKQIA